MTYSIIARDPASGEMGCAVQSHFFSVGPVVPWGEAGVGIVATQAMAQPSYGPAGLDLMRRRIAAPDALRALLAIDPGAEQRQVALIDASGAVAAHTGARCIAHAGHRTADGVSVQANMMERDTVPDAMLSAYTAATSPLAERMLAALDAAEAEGGDIRGRQSAVLLVAPGRGSRIAAPGAPVAGPEAMEPWRRRIDLRVDDAAVPLEELARLLRFARGQEALDLADQREAAGDVEGMLDAYRRAAALVPEDDQIAWMAGGRLLGHGHVEEGLALVRSAVAANAAWPEFARRMAAAGHIAAEAPARIAELLG
jgi:uncharacterized Ntn-hydrolase superfamily protein